ncbi:MAG: MBL fold metallo-hydrolase [Alphaproteobacteria bacterium]|nr:MBL fold metallo-hydrolase [Alphaproteobacteria bacterium]
MTMVSTLRAFSIPALAAVATFVASAAEATCLRLAGAPPLLQRAAFSLANVPAEQVRLTFVGHASFEIETAEGIRAVTDYNGYIRPARNPHIVTMNNSHSTHFTDVIEPEILLALRGWKNDGVLRHNVVVKDLRVRNVPTNLYPIGGGLAHGNSIFVFESANLCIAHISHVHHRLSDDQLLDLGLIDVALVAVDGTVTMTYRELFEALDKIKPRLIVPMHMISMNAVNHFVALAQTLYPVKHHDSDTIMLDARTLPLRPEVLFLKGR